MAKHSRKNSKRFSYKKKTTNRNKTKKNSKRKTKLRKQRGGVCFGNGVGANSNDPNYSIYNTRELSLFPYKPAN